MVIVDTSIAVKWFFPEEDSEAAQDLLRKGSLGAPDLLLYEFSNVLTCRHSLALSDIQKLMRLLFQFQIQFFVLPEKGFLRIAELSRKYKITAYDASFIALAEALEAPLITADSKLHQRVRELPFVQTLSSRKYE